MVNTARLPLLVLMLLLQSSGCQYVSGVNDLEFSSPSAVAQTDWSCLGHPSTSSPTGTVNYTGTIQSLADNSVVADAEFRLCESTDDPCTNPLPIESLQDGVVQFSVDASFQGYVELSSPEMMPGVVELTHPIGKMRVLPELRMVDPATLNHFADLMGFTINDTEGHLLYFTEDCSGQRVPGVSVTPEDAAKDTASDTASYYVIGFKLPSDSVDQTDFSGAGGFINLPPKFVTFEANRADTGALVSQFAARVRAGQVTFAVVEPD